MGGKKGMIPPPKKDVFGNIFGLMRRIVMIFLSTQKRGLSDLSDTLNMFAKSTENFVEAFEKKVSIQK